MTTQRQASPSLVGDKVTAVKPYSFVSPLMGWNTFLVHPENVFIGKTHAGRKLSDSALFCVKSQQEYKGICTQGQTEAPNLAVCKHIKVVTAVTAPYMSVWPVLPRNQHFNLL